MSSPEDIRAYLGNFEKIDLTDGFTQSVAPLEHEALLSLGAHDTVVIRPETNPLVRGLQDYQFLSIGSLEQYMTTATADSALRLRPNQVARLGHATSPQFNFDRERVSPIHALVTATQEEITFQDHHSLKGTFLYANTADLERKFPDYNPKETTTAAEREYLHDRLLTLVPEGSADFSFNNAEIDVKVSVVDALNRKTKVAELVMGVMKKFPELSLPKAVEARVVSVDPGKTQLMDLPKQRAARKESDKAIVNYLPPTPLLRKQFNELLRLTDIISGDKSA